MAVITRIRRAVNPSRPAASKRRPARRRMTPKQIKFFGSVRQKAALKAARARKRSASKPVQRKARTVRRSNPTSNRRRRARRASNPGLLVTLSSLAGAANPQRQSNRKRRVKVMAKKARRSRHRATAVRRRRRTRNPIVKYITRTRRRARRRRTANPTALRRRNSTRIVVIGGRGRRRNGRSYRRHRNPVLGSFNASDVLSLLVGVAAAKFIPTLLPANFVSKPIMRVVATFASAYAAKFAASKIGQHRAAEYVFLGGLAQTASQGFNIVGDPFSRLSLGDLMPGSFPVPQNPIRAANSMPMALPPKGGPVMMPSVSGVNRAYGSAY